MSQNTLDQNSGEQLTDHAYDGIQEYDNPIPGWWQWIFIGSIVFAAFYWFVSSLTSDISPEAFYEIAYTKDLERNFGELIGKQPDRATLLKLSTDDKFVRLGGAIFQTNCASCHGANAQGVTSAPNLTDEAYIHVTKIEDIADVILNGRNLGAMPAWSTKLTPPQVLSVSAYIASLRGTNVAGNPPTGTHIVKSWE
jgi:cytochrome c oxidase cbb3-type subunit III